MRSDTRFLGVKEMMNFLGLGRNRVLRLCQERPNSFPAVRIGNRYQADREKLTLWKDDWYNGKFDLT